MDTVNAEPDWSEVTWNISKSITQSGNYRVTFVYTGGAHRLDIQRAEIWVNGVMQKQDVHDGTTGGSHRANQYRFDGLNIRAEDLVELRANVRPDGGTDSSGNIYVERI